MRWVAGKVIFKLNLLLHEFLFFLPEFDPKWKCFENHHHPLLPSFIFHCSVLPSLTYSCFFCTRQTCIMYLRTLRATFKNNLPSTVLCIAKMRINRCSSRRNSCLVFSSTISQNELTIVIGRSLGKGGRFSKPGNKKSKSTSTWLTWAMIRTPRMDGYTYSHTHIRVYTYMAKIRIRSSGSDIDSTRILPSYRELNELLSTRFDILSSIRLLLQQQAQ